MKQYLLSIYQPDGDPPPPEVLETMRPYLERFHGNPSSIHAAGRHGRDFRYTGVFGAARTLKLGHKYTLRIRIAGQDDIVRTVKLLEERR